MEMFYILKLFGLLIFSYLLGSIPCGLVLTRLFTSEDITRMGSKNIGATNVSRIAGLKLGILTLAGDMLKGAFPVYLACVIINNDSGWSEIQILLTAFFAFCGHFILFI